MNLYNVEITQRDAETGTPSSKTFITHANTFDEVEGKMRKCYGTDYTVETYSCVVLAE
jgi:hypothetical protein